MGCEFKLSYILIFAHLAARGDHFWVGRERVRGCHMLKCVNIGNCKQLTVLFCQYIEVFLEVSLTPHVDRSR